MIVVADACVVAGELVRPRGQRILRAPSLSLVMAEDAMHEAQRRLAVRRHELKRRPDLTAEQVHALIDAALAALQAGVKVLPRSSYAHLESLSRLRVPADGDDWPTVALALVLDGSIWTEDKDFFGCGCPVWRTETLLAEVARLDVEGHSAAVSELHPLRLNASPHGVWANLINQVITDAQAGPSIGAATDFAPEAIAGDIEAANREEQIATLRLLMQSDRSEQRISATLTLGRQFLKEGSAEGLALLQQCADSGLDPYAAYASFYLIQAEHGVKSPAFARLVQPILARLPETDALRPMLAKLTAIIFFGEKDYASVVSACTHLAADQQDPYVRLMLGLSHHALGNIELSTSHYASIVKEPTLAFPAALGLAMAHLAGCDTGHVKAELIKASIAHGADAPLAMCTLDVIATAEGDPDALRRVRAMTNSPHEPVRQLADEAIRSLAPSE